ncbi:MAG: metal ABC transporter substrate-binding protein [Verrucomicrobiia bacterium]
MKTKTLFGLFPLVVGLSLAAHAKLNVVTTTPDFAAVAKAVGGDRVEVTALAKPTEDPHFVDAKPSLILKLNKADVLIEGGAELEIGWLPALLQGVRNPRIAIGAPGRVLASEVVELVEVPTTLDRSRGDVHAMGNPHFMTDPVNAVLVARRIADAFCSLDPAAAEAYRSNLKSFSDRLDAKLAEWQKLLAPFKGQRVVAYHNSWPYFARRFGLQIDLFLEPKPGLPPTPAHLADVMAKMKESEARVIIVQPYLNRHTAESVARNTGAVVVDVADFPGGMKGTEDDYVKFMDHLVASLANALGQISAKKP